MDTEKQELFNNYQKEIENCYELATKMDAYNPELKNAFTGTPSERIENQFEYFKQISEKYDDLQKRISRSPVETIKLPNGDTVSVVQLLVD